MRYATTSIYIDYLIIFILIFTSRETIQFGTTQNETMLIIGYIAPLFVLVLLLIRKGHFRNYNKSSFDLLIILSTCSLLTMFLNFDINVKYGYEILLFLLSYHIANQLEFNKFAKIYCDILQLLAFFAILATVIYFVASPIFSYFPIIENKSHLRYYNLFLSVIPVDRFGVIYRLYGIFREPGVAIIFFNLALAFEMFLFNSKKLIRVFLLLLAIVLSYSTAGYIVSFLIIACYLLYNQKKHKAVTLFASIFFVVLVVIISQSDYFNTMVFGKLTDEDSSSRGARLGSITNNLNLIIENPIGFLWGLGYQFVEDAFVAIGRMSFVGESHNTNTILKELSVHGIFFTIYLITSIYQFVRYSFLLKGLMLLAVFSTILIAFGNEDLTSDILLFLLVFYSRVNKNYVGEFNK